MIELVSRMKPSYFINYNYSTLSNNKVTLLWIWNPTHSCTMCMEYFNLYIIIDKYQKFSIHIPQSEHFSS